MELVLAMIPGSEFDQDAERKDVGKALSPEEESKLIEAVANDASPNRSQTLRTFIRTALLTGMRSGEIASLTWGPG